MSTGKIHTYTTNTEWTGNATGTRDYASYSRNHEISVPGKPVIDASSDPAFKGDARRYNPEELLLASLSSCHMLWYLHLCSEAGITILEYNDKAIGLMQEEPDGSGAFTKVILKPVIKIEQQGKLDTAVELHKKAHQYCFIARSVNFNVTCEPTIIF